MKKLSLILIFSLFVFKSLFAVTYSSDPQKFITELVNDAINKLSDKNISKDEKKKFRLLIIKNIPSRLRGEGKGWIMCVSTHIGECFLRRGLG